MSEPQDVESRAAFRAASDYFEERGREVGAEMAALPRDELGAVDEDDDYARLLVTVAGNYAHWARHFGRLAQDADALPVAERAEWLSAARDLLAQTPAS